MQVYRRFWVVVGALLFALGLIGDSITGLSLLIGGDLWVLLLHIPLAFIWASGLNLTFVKSGRKQEKQQTFAVHILTMEVSGRAITGLLLCIGTFPGFGPIAYSIAMLVSYFFPVAQAQKQLQEVMPELELPLEVSPVLDLSVQPMVDILYSSDLEIRRATVAALSRSANPGAIRLLKQLLSDPLPDIRSDASIALTRLEDDLSRALNVAISHWTIAPEEHERILTLVDCYYEYACSNLLDEVSQRFYLAKACDLLQKVVTLDCQEYALWVKMACVHQFLGEKAVAMQDIQTALRLQPHAPEASLLAMEIAFSLRSWDALISLVNEGLTTLPAATELSNSLQWLLEPRTELHGGPSYG